MVLLASRMRGFVCFLGTGFGSVIRSCLGLARSPGCLLFGIFGARLCPGRICGLWDGSLAACLGVLCSVLRKMSLFCSDLVSYNRK